MDSPTLHSEYSCARCSVSCPTKLHLMRHLTFTHRSLPQTTQWTKFNYECPTCGKEFSGLYGFNRHLFIHQQRTFKCSKCPKTLRSREGIRLHTLRKHGIDEPANYKCDDCGNIFTSLSSFTLHAAIHKPPQFSCNECDRKFFSWSGVLHHTKSAHLGKKPNESRNLCVTVCPQCPMKFSAADHLKGHLQRIHQPKQHKCSHCYREFSTETELSFHLLKAHSVVVEKRFECKICGKLCKSQAGVASHSQYHGNPTIPCGKCSLMFYSIRHLSFHVKLAHTVRFSMPAKTTSKEINYTCAICCRMCGREKTNLQDHLRIHYLKPQVCPLCRKTFNSERVFNDHIRKVHPDLRESFHCDICNTNLRSKKRYQMHMKYHEKPTKTCPNCQRQFYTELALQVHSKTHNSKAISTRHAYASCKQIFACAICLRKFPARREMRNHLSNTHNPITFGCSKCEFKCHRKVGIIGHLRNFHSAYPV